MKGHTITEKEFREIKTMLAEGLSPSRIHSLIDRGLSTISVINKSPDFLSYQQANRERLAKYDTKDDKVAPKVEEVSTNNIPVATDIDAALNRLDQSFEDLKKAVVDVTALIVEERVQEYKRDKEAEITSLKTVVNAAKQTNLAAMLKSRLLGER